MANVSAVDESTRALYAADPAAGPVAAINTATCNARDTASCAQHLHVIKIGASPNTPVVNTATRTLYASYGHNADQVAAVNAENGRFTTYPANKIADRTDSCWTR